MPAAARSARTSPTAPQYTSTALSNTSSSYYGSYTLTYKAVSAGQKLTVKGVQNTSVSGSNVTLYAAALH